MATYSDYRKMLVVHKHRLDDELEIQADLMERIGSELVKANVLTRTTKEHLAEVEGKLTQEEKAADPKATVAMIDAAMRANSRRKQAWREHLDAQAQAEQWQVLWDCWKQRGYSLKTFSDLYAANYFSVTSHTSPDADAQDNRRAEMRRAGARVDDRGMRAAQVAEDSAKAAGIEPRRMRTPTVERMHEAAAPARRRLVE